MQNNSDYYDYEESFRESSGLKRFCDRTGISGFLEKYWKIVVSVMVVVVLVGYIPLYMQKGISFEGDFYRPEKYENGMKFGGTCYYDTFNIRVERQDAENCTVTYTVNDTKKVYRLEFIDQEDVVIYENDELYFEGTREPSSYYDSYVLVSKDEEMSGPWAVYASISSLPDRLSAWQIFNLYLGEEVSRGSTGHSEFTVMAVFVFVAWLLDIWFPRFFFLLRYSMSVDNPEPSDWYVITQKVGWVLLPIFAVGLLVFSLV